MSGSQVSLRTVFTVCFGVLTTAIVAYSIAHMQLAIALVILGGMIAIALHHAVALLRRRLPRWLAITVVAVAILGALATVALLVVPPAVSQARVLAGDLPRLISKVRHMRVFTDLDRQFGLSAAIDRVAETAPTLVFQAVNALLAVIVGVVTVVILAAFMAIFGGPLVARGLAEVAASHRARIARILSNFYQSVGAYVLGITIIALINFVCTATFLAVVRMPFFLPLALLSGIACTVPYVGSIVTSVTITLLALMSSGSWPAVACAVYFVIYGQLEGNVLGPMIFRRAVHVNPLVTTLSILFLGEMFGLIGAFVAIPFVATLQIVVRELLRARREELAERT